MSDKSEGLYFVDDHLNDADHLCNCHRESCVFDMPECVWPLSTTLVEVDKAFIVFTSDDMVIGSSKLYSVYDDRERFVAHVLRALASNASAFVKRVTPAGCGCKVRLIYRVRADSILDFCFILEKRIASEDVPEQIKVGHDNSDNV